MANGTWQRTTTEERRTARKRRYAHVSVAVGVNMNTDGSLLVPTRTPKGEGSTAKRAAPKSGARKVKGHDWPGAYLGKLASIEQLQRDRRNAKSRGREVVRRAAYFASLEGLQT
jgi:hypothetical protein